MSVMVTENGDMDVEEAMCLKPGQILERFSGLPDRKFHCSVLGDTALREAIRDYLQKNGTNVEFLKNSLYVLKDKLDEADDIITFKFLSGRRKDFVFYPRPIRQYLF